MMKESNHDTKASKLVIVDYSRTPFFSPNSEGGNIPEQELAIRNLQEILWRQNIDLNDMGALIETYTRSCHDEIDSQWASHKLHAKTIRIELAAGNLSGISSLRLAQSLLRDTEGPLGLCIAAHAPHSGKKGPQAKQNFTPPISKVPPEDIDGLWPLTQPPSTARFLCNDILSCRGKTAPLVHGAAALLVARQEAIKDKKLKSLAVLEDSLSLGPGKQGRNMKDAVDSAADVIQQLCLRNGLSLSQIHSIEVHEPSTQFIDNLRIRFDNRINPSNINPEGGALALGHAKAVTGIRLIGSLARRLTSLTDLYGIALMTDSNHSAIGVLLKSG